MLDGSEYATKSNGDEEGCHTAGVGSIDIQADYEKIKILIINCSTEAGHKVNFFEHKKTEGSLLLQPVYRCGQKLRGPNEKEINDFHRLLVKKIQESRIGKQIKICVRNSRANADSLNFFCLVLQL